MDQLSWRPDSIASGRGCSRSPTDLGFAERGRRRGAPWPAHAPKAGLGPGITRQPCDSPIPRPRRPHLPRQEDERVVRPRGPAPGDQQVRRRARRRPLVRAPRRARGRNRERRRRLCRGGTQPVLWPRGRFGRRRRRRVICRRRSCGRACGSPVRPVDRRAPVLGSAAVAEAIAAPREPGRRKRSPGPGTPAATRIP